MYNKLCPFKERMQGDLQMYTPMKSIAPNKTQRAFLSPPKVAAYPFAIHSSLSL